MFDIGLPELLMVAVVLILVVGPKDLPPMLRSFGRTVKKYRSMANDFKSQFNDALDESELDELRQTVADVKSYNPLTQLKDSVKEVGADINDVKPWAPKPEEISEAARSVGTKEAKAKATAARKSVAKKTTTPRKTSAATKKPTSVAKKPAAAAKKPTSVKPVAKKTVAKATVTKTAPVAKKPAVKTAASKSTTVAGKTTRKPRAAVAKKPAAPKGKAEAK